MKCEACDRIPAIQLDVCVKCNSSHHTYPYGGCSNTLCVKCHCFRCAVARTRKIPIYICWVFTDDSATENDFYKRLIDNEYPEINNRSDKFECIKNIKLLGNMIIKSYVQ
jgi:hypothetical protein